MTTPEWQLPVGVDRGLWDYLHSAEMVAGYDAQVAASPLAAADVAFCERHFPAAGRVVDLGCGTGRLCVRLARKGYDVTGVDLSPEMLARAWANADAAGVRPNWLHATICDLEGLEDASFDAAACLFSTLGMLRGAGARRAALAAAARVLKPGGVLVLHAHNRWYAALGMRRLLAQAARTLTGSASAGDVTMPQAYGGAPLTLHHFTRRELLRAAAGAGFRLREWRPVSAAGAPARGPGAYGFLAAFEKA